MKNTYTFTLPRSFDVQEFLTPPRLALRADDARWLVSTILRKTANRDTDPWGCVRLDSKILHRIMGNNTSDIIRSLEQGAIECMPYTAGVRCRGFRLARRFLGDRCIRRPATDPRLLDRIEQERKRLEVEESSICWLPIHFALNSEQQRLSIDTTESDAIVEGLPEYSRLCQDVLVSHLRNHEFSFSVSTTGRVFNAITGLKRELRRALRIGGEHLGSIDIACAQPALLALEMTDKIPAVELKGRKTYKDRLSSPLSAPPALCPPCSVSSFRSIVASGRFYELLMSATGLARDVVKRGFLRDVLAKRGRYPSFVEDAFRIAFPTVYAYIRAVNCEDHGELIRRLQRAESRLVIEQVAPRLVSRVPVVTLHDAIYSTHGSLSEVEKAFYEVFDRMGIRLTLKREASPIRKTET